MKGRTHAQGGIIARYSRAAGHQVL
jgi:hypothetical protein